MKQFFRYLYDCRYVWLWAVISGAVFAGIFALYGIRMEAVWYPLLLSALFGLLFLVLGFLKYRRKHIELERLHPGETPCAEYLPRADSLTERDYQALVFREEEANRARKEAWDSARNDMNDYYAVWVHQIKAPIAVMRVMLQQEDTQENRELSAELFRIEQYAEMALYYIRLGEGASDLVIQEYELDDIVRKAVRKYAGQFIRRKIRLVYNGTDERVVTDEKWLSFIIEQLLSNAVKYTPEGGTVTISADDRKQLSVTDTGIGISPEDLPRIFEKGYTGYNGRLDKKSTGIGLYLCKTAADKLGHRLRKNGDDTAVVFLTAYPQYAAESYVIEAWQYVLKEQMEERFPEILHRLISSLLEEKKDYRIVGDGCGKEKLYYRDILYIQKDKKGGKYAEYVTGEKIYRERISIGRLLEEIGDERFILLDRGHVLNVQHIEKLERGWVYLLGGHRFSVSRIQYSHIKERIACYMEGL